MYKLKHHKPWLDEEWNKKKAYLKTKIDEVETNSKIKIS